MKVETPKMPRKVNSSLAEAFSSQGETTGIIRYRLIRGYMNQRCPAIEGKLKGSLLRSSSDWSQLIPPQRSGRKV